MEFLTQRQADLALLARWRTRRDPHAFHELAGRYGGFVFNTCRRVLCDPNDAEEVAQECFLTLAVSDAVIETSLGSWLHRVATRRAIDRLRSDIKRRRREQEFADSLPQAALPQWNELQGQIDAAIDALPEEQRRVLVAHFLEGKTQKAIAKDLGISRRVAAYRIQRAIDSVRDQLQCQGAGAELKRLDGLLASGALACLGKALPSTLSAALAKLSISGLPPMEKGAAAACSIHSIQTLAFGVIAMKKVSVIVVALAALVAGWYLLEHHRLNKLATPAQARAQENADTAMVRKQAPAAEPAGVEASDEPQPAAAKLDMVPRKESATPVKTAPFIHETDQFATVTGLVLDQEDAPIVGATVRVIATGLDPDPGENASRGDYRRATIEVFRSPEHAFTAETDADGTFLVEGIRYTGMAFASAEAEGFGPKSQMLMLKPNDEQEVTIHLSEGVLLQGRVVDTLRRPVTDGTVTLTTLVVQNSGSSGAQLSATTDKAGVFRLWLTPWGDGEAKACFEVASDTHGKMSVGDVAIVPGEPITLQYQPMSSMHGKLTWSDNTPAEGCTVRLSGVTITNKANGGTVSSAGLEYEATSAANGEYRIEDIDSAQSYTVDVLTPSGEMAAAGRELGSFITGEDKEWDCQIEEHANLSGTVYGTETRSPLAGRIVRCVPIDGPASASFVELQTTTDENGIYSLQVHSGQGLYRVHADYGMLPNGADFAGAEMEYAKQVALAPGKKETVDLELPEPWKCGFAITDTAGVPVEGAAAYVQETLPTGGTISNAYPWKSDAAGKIEIEGLTPGATTCFRFSCSGFLEVTLNFDSGEMSGMEPITFTGSPGEVYPEQHVVLHQASSIAAGLVDSAGESLARTPLVITVYDGNDIIASAETSTDPNGEFFLRDGVPAVSGVIEIVARVKGDDADRTLTYTSPELDLPAHQTIDLGTLVLNGV